MKSYDETITSVFDKIQTHRAKQKRKKQIVLSAVVPVCLMAVCITGLWMYQKQNIKDYTLNDPTAPVSMDSAVLPTSPVPTTEPAESSDRIIINPMRDVPDQRMDIALMWDDAVSVTLEELNQYYGTDIIPMIPDDLTRWSDEHYHIFKREKGTGEIYYDQNIQNFSNKDFSRYILVETAKGDIPFNCVVVYGTEKEYSIINGIEVAIGQHDNGFYSVWFMYQNTGFYVNTMGVTEEELVDVIRSLTD